MFSNLVKGKVMDADDLEPVLRGVKESLVEKNVAVDIADKLCDSVAASLEGKRMDSWVGVKGTVKTALEDSLTRILTPKQSLDIVREIHHVRQHESRPYVIVFCGVNGVGKSTSLAKVRLMECQFRTAHALPCTRFCVLSTAFGALQAMHLWSVCWYLGRIG